MANTGQTHRASGITFDGNRLTWPTYTKVPAIALGRGGGPGHLYPGIWEELEFSGNSGHLVGSLRRPASVRDMISAIKQSGTISAVLGVEAAFHWFGIDLGQCLDYRLPSGLKISIDPTRQTMIWPAKPCALRSSPVADGYLGDWLASYTPGNRVFSLRYSSAYRAGLVDLAEINGTNEVAAHIRAALNQFGIKR